MTEIEVFHTHLYPGACGRVTGLACDGPAVVRFADNASVMATLAGGCLDVAAYRTAACTWIRPRRWVIEISGDSLRILRSA